MIPITEKLPAVLTVTGLTARIKQVLEQGFSQIQVEAEVSRLTRAASGHLYFTMKDCHATVSAVVWRSTALRLKTRLQEGQSYVFHGHISVYEPRGTYQMVVTAVHALGAGALAEAFEQRKRLFAQRGWFAPERKKPIPLLPKHIAVMTSGTSAAWEDVKKVLRTRPAYLRISLIPCLVQGEQAPQSLQQAFEVLRNMDEVPDVLLLVRGGGSMEDLWCFNDEAVVQAVVNCEIPVISGVGHEIDTTLVDLAADVRAATPSNAAELCCPSRDELRQRIPSLARLSQLMQQQCRSLRQAWLMQWQQLRYQQQRSVEQCLYRHAQQSEALQQRVRASLREKRRLLMQVQARLQRCSPHQRLRYQRQQWQQCRQLLWQARPPLQQYEYECQRLHVRLSAAAMHQYQTQRQAYARAHEALQALNPKSILQRGYSLTYDANGHILDSVSSVQAGDRLRIHLADGVVDTRVDAVKENP